MTHAQYCMPTNQHTDQKNRKHQKARKSKGKDNRKAFTFTSARRANKAQTRALDIATKRHHVPVECFVTEISPPIVVCIAGSPKVGKSTFISSMIKRYNKQQISNIKGPITIVTGKAQRMTLIECNNDINSMIDLAKISDVVVLLIDATFGFELEIFEMISILQSHGFPKIIGILTHYDLVKHSKVGSKYISKLKHQLWKETYDGAKLYCIKKFHNNLYSKEDMLVVSRFLTKSMSAPPSWHTSHSYILSDRIEDITEPETIRKNPEAFRTVSFYGYVHGSYFRCNKIHIPGCGDFSVKCMSLLPDPCLPPITIHRTLGETERIVYAPFSGLGNLIYDKDAVYMNIPQKSKNDDEITEQNVRLNSLKNITAPIDAKLSKAPIQIFEDGPLIFDHEIEQHNQIDVAYDDIESFKIEIEASTTKSTEQFFESTPHMALSRKIYHENKSKTNDDYDDEVFCAKDQRPCVDNTRSYATPFDLNMSEAIEEIKSYFITGKSFEGETLLENEVEDRSKKVKQSKIQMEKNVKQDEKYLNLLKEDIEKKEEFILKELESMNVEEKIIFQGYQPGQYVRIEINSVPPDFIENFDPNYPVILGSILSGEDDTGIIKLRVKKHKFYNKIQKSNDPMILSIGWRRYQSMMIYAMEDHNKRLRFIKYTPTSMFCTAMCYGPITPVGFGVIGFQKMSAETDTGFRICLTGVTLEADKTCKIVKKLKLVGYPHEIYKKTAFIKGMFNSSLEAAKFEGALIKTVSGIRGHIKRAASDDGIVRVTFEDKILMSDIVFIRTWVPVQCPSLYLIVKNLLLPPSDRLLWIGVRTVSELKRDLSLKGDIAYDSLYKPIERRMIKFAPIKIPEKLIKQLPFKIRPKNQIKSNQSHSRPSRTTLTDKKALSLLNQLSLISKESLSKQKDKRKKYHEMKKIQDEKMSVDLEKKKKLVRKNFFRKSTQTNKKFV